MRGSAYVLSRAALMRQASPHHRAERPPALPVGVVRASVTCCPLLHALAGGGAVDALAVAWLLGNRTTADRTGQARCDWVLR